MQTPNEKVSEAIATEPMPVDMKCTKCKKLVLEISETDMCCIDCTSDKERMRDFDSLWSLCAEVMADECEEFHRDQEGVWGSHKGSPTCVCWLPEALILMTPRERKKYGVHIFSDWVPVLADAYRGLLSDIYHEPYGTSLGMYDFRFMLKDELLEKRPNIKLENLKERSRA